PDTRELTEHVMKTWDGTELFYRVWPARVPSDKALLLFHRGHEHSGRFQELVDELGPDDVNIFAWDQRGHGHSPGERGYAENFGCLVKDVDAFVRHIGKKAFNNLAGPDVRSATASGLGRRAVQPRACAPARCEDRPAENHGVATASDRSTIVNQVGWTVRVVFKNPPKTARIVELREGG
ncbi:MAG TPA: alpha/beta hydrolase, partial [Gemmataceae bacterium]|nr:alpha/beta hydrolase [Gemmataceae bacterium]